MSTGKRVRNYGLLLGFLAIVLAVAHLVTPQYTWGQGRRSLFFLANRLTLASWLTSMCLLACAGFTLIAAVRAPGRSRRRPWLAGTALLLFLSFCAITWLPTRLGWLATELATRPGHHDALLLLAGRGHLLVAGVLLVFAYARWLHRACAAYNGLQRFILPWAAIWILGAVSNLLPLSDWFGFPSSWLALMRSESFLLGAIVLFVVLGTIAFAKPRHLEDAEPEAANGAPPVLRTDPLLLLGIGGTAAVAIAFEIVLVQILFTFGDYVSAYSAISIALLGIAAGGQLAFRYHDRAPVAALMVASGFLPIALTLGLGAAALHCDTPVTSSLLLTGPFVCASVVISLSLSLSTSHVIYFADLLGASVGAIGIGLLVTHLREESAVLVLAACAALCTGCLAVRAVRSRRNVLIAGGVALVLAAGFTRLAGANLATDLLNTTRTYLQRKLPDSEILYSKSTLVGRIDIVRRKPGDHFLKTLENGHAIDTVRPFATETYAVDPRLPRTLIDDPDILILGLAGEGIAKTAKNIGRRVSGVEINPAIAKLMTDEVAPYGKHPYNGIEVAVMDGRTYLERTAHKFDFITLMNSHAARGRMRGRAPSPEYLHTVEAFQEYLDHLNDRGYVVIEEPVNRPAREPPIWKILATIRTALADRGAERPEDHFLVFQWTTNTNNYVQILVKKSPVEKGDIAAFRLWLAQCTAINKLEDRTGRRLGPIHHATYTTLYVPGETSNNSCARVIRGQVDPGTVDRYNLIATTDDRPFPFDVKNNRTELRKAYLATMLLILPLAPLFAGFVRHYRQDLRGAMPFFSTAALTGLGYLLLEIALLQRYQIYLGSPTLTLALVLGTMLTFSGLGSLASGKVGWAGAGLAAFSIVAFIFLLLAMTPALFAATAGHGTVTRGAIAALSLAPLAFAMGIPFALILRLAKLRFAPSAAAAMFAVNGVAGALAVPLALNLTTSYGFTGATAIGVTAYAIVALSLWAAQKAGRLLTVSNGLAATALCALPLVPWLESGFFHGPSSAAAGDVYEVYAVSYGRSTFRYDKLVEGADREKVPLQWYFWVIRNEHRTVLVDTGFATRGMARLFKVRGFAPSDERLRELGVHPDDVSDVILTHLHWDHAGNLAPYQNATVWLQKPEYENAAGTLSPENANYKGMRYGDLQRLEKIRAEGRLRLLEGDATIYPGITAMYGGFHTPGSQFVRVQTADGPIILAGDSSYLFENVLRRRPIGTTVDRAANLAALERMTREAISPWLIVPGHDPKVLKYYPAIGPGIVRITAGA